MPPTTQPPAPRPCESCPYRQDVFSGLWDREEYEKLPRYDVDTPAQPSKLFLCHQTGPDHPSVRICAGWAGCHDGDNLLALRYALAQDRIDATTYQASIGYTSPVPVFTSGAEAAAHGLTDINNPGPGARQILAKLSRTRSDLSYPKDDQVTTFRVPIQLQQPPTTGHRFGSVTDFTDQLFDLLGVFAPITASTDPRELAEAAITRISDREFVAEVTITASSVAAMTPPGLMRTLVASSIEHDPSETTPSPLPVIAEAVVARALRGLGYDEHNATIDAGAITTTEPTPST
ncbi:hypothetical protein GCM10029976_066770 [Kribbella albertanoniae]|uniref:DUF6283 family protein n=1 Tax=Kribbella albertanoniae TaxID=1266829 RepID=UPI00192D2322|nr:DUF6283 family protein [Kribbella albertanoniae]